MMCISTRGRYATRILVLLAGLAPDETMTKQEIAVSENLTPGYVQQLMTPLQAAGLVLSHRGKQGGFRLARSPETVTVAEALRVMEGECRLVPCHDGENCDRIAICPTRPIWVGAAMVLENYFRQTTIADLAKQAEILADAAEPIAIPAGVGPPAHKEKGARV